jgi:hypothetical protein
MPSEKLDPALDAEFEYLWAAWPKRNGVRSGKSEARRRYDRLPRRDREAFKRAAPKYAEHIVRHDEYPCDMTTFINARRWLDYDDYEMPPPPPVPLELYSCFAAAQEMVLHWRSGMKRQAELQRAGLGWPPDERREWDLEGERLLRALGERVDLADVYLDWHPVPKGAEVVGGR